MLIFPIIYFSSFFIAIKQLFNQNKQGIFIFLIFGLPIYTTSLSIVLQDGLGSLIPVMQLFKELLTLITLGMCTWELKKRIRLLPVDYYALAYLGLTFMYVIFPVGSYGFFDRMIAFKSSSFFIIIYATGRLFNPRTLYISKYFHYILAVIIAASIVLIYEILTDQHFQLLSGYPEFNYRLFNQEPSGNYGLSWTFETSTGLKRFASFFANPLEYGAATLVALAVIAGLYTTNENKFKIDLLGLVAVLATQFSIFFALSRASLASYFIMIYVYAMATKNRKILNLIHFGLISGIIYFVFFLFVVHPDLYDFIYETITFTNPSSVGHIIAWLEGIDSIVTSPQGLGLGQSGRVAVSNNDTIGGENQIIIFAVQTGILSAILYISMLVYLIRKCWFWFPKLQGKERKICLALLLMKVGFIIPLLTTEFESYSYISYISWFLSGIFVNIISDKTTENSILLKQYSTP
jgi:hypothetical protein